MPIFSIITVCYNEVDKIRKTCESVANQSFTDFEWIVVDGGSTDGTVEILKEHQSLVKTLVSEKDRGIYHAMNKGIAHATGQYLLFLNGGDYLRDKTTLQKAADFISQSMEPLYYGEIKLNNGHELYVPLRNVPVDELFFFKGLTLNHQAMFIDKSLFDQFGLYDESYKLLADVEWCARVIIKHDVVPTYMDQTVSVFDVGGASQSPNSAEIIRKERARYLKDIFPFFKTLRIILTHPSVLVFFLLRPYKNMIKNRLHGTKTFNRTRDFYYKHILRVNKEHY